MKLNKELRIFFILTRFNMQLVAAEDFLYPYVAKN